MKKAIFFLLTSMLCVSLLAGCGQGKPQGPSGTPEPSNSQASGNKIIETLRIAFIPTKDPDEIITATEPLKQILTDELAKLGYDVRQVAITVGTSYAAVGEAMAAGTADVGLVPGGTYVLYDDGCDVLLTATRNGLSIDSENAKDWNDNAPTEAVTKQVTGYRSLVIAGPSEKGKELAEKVNAGEKLTWEDISSANWCVAGSSSSGGYIYPSLWLQENFSKNITDLPHAVQYDSAGSAFARLASSQVDIVCIYADARRDYADKWTGEYAMTNSIWEDTNIVGVTPFIYNDTISISKTSPIMDTDFRAALSEAFINIGNTEEGKAVISIYGHNGYQSAKTSDYDYERAAQKMIQSLNSAG